MEFTDQEYKEFVMQITLKISPVMVQEEFEFNTKGENIAMRARDIADAVCCVLNGEL